MITAFSNQYAGQSYYCTDVQNSEVAYKEFMQAGTYSISIFCTKDVNRGICTILIDGVSVGTLDMAAGSALYNQILTLSSITVATSGAHTITFKMATTSTGHYYMTLSFINIKRTA